MIIKFGIDPNGKLHLGHFYIIKSIEKYMDNNDILLVILGDFTCKIGDPSMMKSRRKNFLDNISDNMNYIIRYINMFFKKKVIFLKNSYWYTNMNFLRIVDLLFRINYRDLTNRKDIKKRIKNKQSINILEILYPLFQGYDSIVSKPNIEFGGIDQRINFNITNKIQKIFSKKTKFIELSLIKSLNKESKMSKSDKDGCIFLHEKTDIIFKKILNIDDKKICYYIKKFNFLLKRVLYINIKENFFIRKKFYFFYLVFNFKKDITFNFYNYYKKYKILKSKRSFKIIDILIENKVFLYKKQVKRCIKQNSIFINKNVLKDKNFIVSKNDEIIIGKKNFFIFK